MLRAIRAQLATGGRFAIDVTNRDFVVRNLRETMVYKCGDNFLIERLFYDTKTRRMRNDRVAYQIGRETRDLLAQALWVRRTKRAFAARRPSGQSSLLPQRVSLPQALRRA